MAGTFQLPCLGRPFHLGMLYDSCREKIIPGKTLWNADILQSALQSQPQLFSKFEIFAEDGIDIKSTGLGISADMKLGFMSGLVKVSGSAEYLDDRKTSAQQARVTLKYSSTTHFEELTMEQISKIQHPNIFEDMDATHVVTGVLYGSDAFFVFDRQIEANESIQDVHGQMEVLVRKIPCISEDQGGSGSLKVKEHEEIESVKFRCTFYGDLILQSNPSNYAEAINLYRDLPNLLNNKSVPKVVYLYPLSKLRGKPEKLLHSISSNLIADVQEIMEGFHSFEMMCKDLKRSDTCSKFSDVGGQIAVFMTLLNRYKHKMVSNLSQLVPNIREKKSKESELSDLIESTLKSPFNSKAINSFIQKKSRELKVLGQCLKNMAKSKVVKQVFSGEGNELFNYTANFDYKYVVCFSLNVTSERSPFINKLDKYLLTGEEPVAVGSEQEWFEKQPQRSALRTKSASFLDFVLANESQEDIAFVITNKNDDIDCSSHSIVLYTDGDPVEFDPPQKPQSPQFRNIRHDGVEVFWELLQNVSTIVHSYNVYYSTNADKNFQKLSTNDRDEKSVDIPNLLPDTKYFFKIEAVSDCGVSPVSIISSISTASRICHSTEMKKFSTLIEEGVPSVYELPKFSIETDSQAKLSKVIVGLKKSQSDNHGPLQSHSSSNGPHKVMMVVGATGSGKTTLINAMANYIYGVEWEESYRFKAIAEKTNTSQSRSQTKYITAYKFQSTDLSYDLTVIDTPGFGDTDGGIEKDHDVERQIKKFFSKYDCTGIDQLNGIGFVIQAPLARLTATQKYIFQAIFSIFGKDVEENIFIMTTFADGKNPPVLTAVKDAEIPYGEYFKFNNSALFTCNEAGKIDSDINGMMWKMGHKSFAKFFSYFVGLSPKSLTMTKEVLQERETLEALIITLHEDVKIGLAHLNEIEQEDRVLKQHEADINVNRDFVYIITIEKHRKVLLTEGINTTNCLVCSRTCHNGCAFSKDEDKDKCCMIKKGYCIACPEKCHWKKHSNTPYIFEYYKEDEERTSDDLKVRYDRAQTGKNKAKSMIDRNREALNGVRQDTLENITLVRRCITRLGEIALKPNPLTLVEYIDILIESEKSEHKDGWLERVSQLKNLRSDSELLQRIQTSEIPENEDLFSFLSGKKESVKKSLQAVGTQLKSAKTLAVAKTSKWWRSLWN